MLSSALAHSFGADHTHIAKADLRQCHLGRRAVVDEDTRRRLAWRMASIGANLVQDFVSGSEARVVSLFSPIRHEPDPSMLAAALEAQGVPLSLPVDETSGGPLRFRLWSPGDRLAAGPLGIAEPVPEAPAVLPDILILPLLAFDRLGHRLGYGVGNVDSTLRFLRARKRILALGVAFATQEEPSIPVSAHDEAVDLVLTEHDLVDCRPIIESGM